MAHPDDPASTACYWVPKAGPALRASAPHAKPEEPLAAEERRGPWRCQVGPPERRNSAAALPASAREVRPALRASAPHAKPEEPLATAERRALAAALAFLAGALAGARSAAVLLADFFAADFFVVFFAASTAERKFGTHFGLAAEPISSSESRLGSMESRFSLACTSVPVRHPFNRPHPPNSELEFIET